MIQLLCIGNSFSEDAMHYLHDLSVAHGKNIHIVNLFIGGCSLATHWENLNHQQPVYDYQVNGQTTTRYVSLTEAIFETKWDYISLQQASHDSGICATYSPAIEALCEFLRHNHPQAQLLLHETWAYEIDSKHPGFSNYNYNQQQMYQQLSACYQHYHEKLQLTLIRSGSFIQTLRSNAIFDYANGGKSLCRDGFHLDFTVGRYAVAALWFKYLFADQPSHVIPQLQHLSEFELSCLTVIDEQLSHFSC